LAVGVRVNGLLAQQLGHILMGGLLIAAEVQKSVTIREQETMWSGKYQRHA